MSRRGLSVVGDGCCLVYSRHFEAIPKGREHIRTALLEFVRDVSYAVPEVDQRVQAHIAGLESEIEKNFNKYAGSIKQSKTRA